MRMLCCSLCVAILMVLHSRAGLPQPGAMQKFFEDGVLHKNMYILNSLAVQLFFRSLVDAIFYYLSNASSCITIKASKNFILFTIYFSSLKSWGYGVMFVCVCVSVNNLVCTFLSAHIISMPQHIKVICGVNII